MAEKRMFSKSVIGSDNFLEMPDSTQNLYFHLSMSADDDGFVSNYKSIMRMTGKKEDDLKILIAKSFVLPFDSGILVIRHWRVNNYLRSDRYKETQYLEEKSKIKVLENGEYNFGIPLGIPLVDADILNLPNSNTNLLIEENNNKFIIPTIEEVTFYCKERNNDVNPEKWWNFYNSKNWYVGKNKMKNWKSAIITWEKDNSSKQEENKFASLKLGTVIKSGN